MFRSTLREYARTLASNPNIPLLYVTTAFIAFGQGIIGPVLPLYAAAFGVGAAMIGVVVGAFGIARLIVNLPAGLMSERYGRRLLLVGGPAISFISSVLMGIAGSYPELVIYRFMYGVGSAMYMTGSMTFIADFTTRENRARFMGLQSASMHIGTSLGPAIGGVIAGLWGFRVPFFVLSSLCAFSTLWAYFRLPETKDWVSGRESVEAKPETGTDMSVKAKPGVVVMLSNLTFVLVSLVTLMLFFTRAASHHTLLPIVGTSDKVGLTMVQVGVAFSAISFINMLMTFPASILADRYGRKAIILPGILLDATSLIVFSFSTSYWSFIVAGLLMGLGTGMANPTQAAYAADLARKGNIGVTMGLFRTFGDAGFFIGPIMLGWVADLASYESALWVNAGLLLVVSLLLAMAAKETVVRKRQGDMKSLV